jgi:hypothetical protein
MAGALIKFTPNGATDPITLADDANKLTTKFGEASQECVVQKTPLAGSPVPFQTPRGNVSGQFVFTTTNSYATLDDMIAAMKAAFLLTGLQGQLVLSRGASTMIMDGAILQKVSRANESEGVRLDLAYVFAITTIS